MHLIIYTNFKILSLSITCKNLLITCKYLPLICK